MNKKAIIKLRQGLLKKRLDAFLITNGVNVSYLSGFRGEAQLLVSPTKNILIVDFRFKEQAVKKTRGWQIFLRPGLHPLATDILSLAKRLRLKQIGFESANLSFKFYSKLKSLLHPIKLVSTPDIVEQLRAIKSPEEIGLLKKSAALAVKSLIFARRLIRPGKKEIEIAREIQYFMRTSGADDCAFDIIVASGKRSSMPHAPASGKIIRSNEPVLVDLGCRLLGYNSDLTRMLFLGKINGKIKHIYAIILQAQQRAIEAIKAGVEIRQIDKIARQYIAKERLASFFGHALGHGIGREVHEYPTISPHNQDILKEGMVFTVEPGIYIAGLGGVRVEDMVMVTKKGCEILTRKDR